MHSILIVALNILLCSVNVCYCDTQQSDRHHQQQQQRLGQGEQYRGQEIRGVFPVVEIPPAYSENRQDAPIPSQPECVDGRCSVCINGQCFNSDGSPVTRRPVTNARTSVNTHNCRDGRCQPCRGSECPLSEVSDWSVGSGASGSGGSSQIRVGRVSPNGEPLLGGGSGNTDQQNPSNYRYYGYGGYGQGKKSKKSKHAGPDPSVYPTFPCQGDRCSTCLGSKCYPRTYATIRIPVYGRCPPAACEDNCTGFVTSNVDSCPICVCSGFTTREPCMNRAECPSHGSCQNYLCRYAPLPQYSSNPCQFAYQCRSNEQCRSGSCSVDGSGVLSHLESRTCAHDYHCPTDYFCRDSTCWTDSRARQNQPSPTPVSQPAQHSRNRPCAFHYQCPSTFLCQQTHCIQSGVQHNSVPCSSDVQCSSAEYCVDRTCIPSRNVGFVKIPVTHLYRCQYVPCRNRRNGSERI